MGCKKKPGCLINISKFWPLKLMITVIFWPYVPINNSNKTLSKIKEFNMV